MTEEDHRRLAAEKWVLLDETLRKRYCGQYVAVTLGKIWGVGANYAEARAAAQATPECPPPGELALMPVYEFSAEESPDYAWCLTDEAVQQECGSQIAVLQGRRIWGKGLEPAEAWEDACRKPGCPQREELEFVFVPWMSSRQSSPPCSFWGGGVGVCLRSLDEAERLVLIRQRRRRVAVMQPVSPAVTIPLYPCSAP